MPRKTRHESDGYIAGLESSETYKEKALLLAILWDWVEKNIYRTNVLKGWLDRRRRPGEQIALMHSELSEALEGFRHGNPKSDKIPSVTQAEEELADLLIRLMDMSYTMGYNIPKALFLKMEYNKSRPYRHGNKRF